MLAIGVSDGRGNFLNLFAELKRRNVFKVAAAYVIVGWLIMQVGDTLGPALYLPEWINSALAFFLILGFPLAMFFAWAFEMTPDGIKKEKDIERDSSVTRLTGRKLDFYIIGLLVVALGYFAFDKFVLDEDAMGSGSLSPSSGQAQTEASSDGLNPTPDAAKPDAKSIAVLPFANRSNEDDDQFFTDGIHDDLLTQLAKIGDLKVISRTSMMKYKDTQLSIPEIARELNVATILEGGVQRAGQRIRINAQLIDVSTDEHLWAETFDREMTIENLFDIQSEITRQIVVAVRGELTEAEQQTLGEIPTDNLEAFEAFMRARAVMNRADYAQQKYIEAEPWLQKAVALDPEFADAWALLTEIHGQAIWIGYDRTPERLEEAKFALDKAVTLNPASATVKSAEADFLYRIENDYPAALSAYEEAHSIAPGDARILLFQAITLRRLGRFDESMSTFEKALELDPANVFIVTQMADTLAYMNEWDRVEAVVKDWVITYPDSGDLKSQQIRAKIYLHGDVRAAREIFEFMTPWVGYMYDKAANLVFRFDRDFDAWIAILESSEILEFQKGEGMRVWYFSKAQAYQFGGKIESARQYFQKTIDEIATKPSIVKLGKPFDQSLLGMSHAYLGDNIKALEASRKAVELGPTDKDHLFGPIIERNHALVLAMTGHRDEALMLLEAYLETPRGYTRWGLHLDPAWDFFRDNGRFNALIRPLNLEDTQQ